MSQAPSGRNHSLLTLVLSLSFLCQYYTVCGGRHRRDAVVAPYRLRFFSSELVVSGLKRNGVTGNNR